MRNASNEQSSDALAGRVLSRRSLLQAGPTAVFGARIAGAGGPATPGNRGSVLHTPAPPIGVGTLVLVSLDGGNDGLNTVIPYTDSAYRSRRGPLAYGADEVLTLDRDFGLHPSLPGLKARWDEGRLAIVHGVGLPNANRSHFRATDVWDTAVPDGFAATGWLGRWADGAGMGKSAVAAIGATAPKISVGRRNVGARLPLAAYSPANAARPQLDAQLDVIAAHIESGSPTRAFVVRATGFDTHADQRDTHARLLAMLDRAIRTFYEKLRSHPNERAVTVVVRSEFGRRIDVNGSLGTDHGTAAPVLVLGSNVRGGHYGEAPNLENLVDGDIQPTTDFRSVYATVLEQVLQADSRVVLGGTFAQLGFV